MANKEKVTVIGAGNIGTLMAAEIAVRGYDVCLYAHSKENISGELSVFDADDALLYSTKLKKVTDKLETALEEADFVFVTYPSFMLSGLCEQMLPLIRKEAAVCIVPGSGGAEFAFKPLIDKGVTLCGLQRVHSIARLKQKGKSVYMLGRKDSVQLGAIPSRKTAELSQLVGNMLSMPCEALENYLSVTLTPSNPILHTTRLYSMFRDWHEGVYYPENIPFYESWTDNSSRELFACDEELQEICKALSPLDLSAVRSLKLHYESDTPEKLTAKIKSIKAFRGILSPMKETKNGFIPDLESRYFTADFPYGLKVLIEFGKATGIDTPNMNKVWSWYLSLSPEAEKNCFVLPDSMADKIADFYK